MILAGSCFFIKNGPFWHFRPNFSLKNTFFRVFWNIPYDVPGENHIGNFGTRKTAKMLFSEIDRVRSGHTFWPFWTLKKWNKNIMSKCNTVLNLTSKWWQNAYDAFYHHLQSEKTILQLYIFHVLDTWKMYFTFWILADGPKSKRYFLGFGWSGEPSKTQKGVPLRGYP